ncbi:MAG: VWA domain-containing protein [Phototrophicaceae bacterium]
MSFKFDPFDLLGLRPSASRDDVDVAYNSLITHLNSNPSEASSKQLALLEEAYHILIHPNRKKEYIDYLDSLSEEDKKNNRFNLRLTPSKRAVKTLEEEQVIYILAEMFAPSGIEQKMDDREVNLNLTLVIDQSKSMDDGGRMRRVIGAAQAIITELTHNDVISIVAFNDRASAIIPATNVTDVMALRTRVGMIKPKGGTEIFQGLAEGVKQNRKFLDSQMINHIILLTDGQTYGDEQECLQLARKAASEGISISAMGLGNEWNDEFLDQLVAATGGTSTYIKSVNMVSDFMQLQLRSLSNAFAERMVLSIITNPEIKIEMAFKISPNPQPLTVENNVIHLASLQAKRPISVLLQIQLPANMTDKFINIGRFMASGDIMLHNADTFYTAGDMSLEIDNDNRGSVPPSTIVDALSKLTLYRLQEKARNAMEDGNIDEATRHLKYLATRLIDMGEHTLGQQAMAEAQHVQMTRAFSNEETKKTIKYQTRALIEPGGIQKAITTLFDND